MTNIHTRTPARGSSYRAGTFPLELSGLVPVAHGSEREVYVHPDHPDVVFKIVEGKNLAQIPTKFEHVTLKIFPDKLKMRRSEKELQSYTYAKMRYHRADLDFPAAEMRGFYETDMGLAVAFEKISGDGGSLAMSHERIQHKFGLDEEHVSLLNDFVSRLLAWNLIASDLNLGNIVLGMRRGKKQFVLIDGMGAPHLIPLRYLSRTFNKKELVRRIERVGREINGMGGRIQLNFDRNAQEFVIAEYRG